MSHSAPRALRRLLPLTALFVCLGAAPAFAVDTVSNATPGTIAYSQSQPPANEANNLLFTYDTAAMGAVMVFDQTPNNLTAAGTCTNVDGAGTVAAPGTTPRVRCANTAANPATAVTASLGDGIDQTTFQSFATSGLQTVTLNGEAGNDTLRTPPDIATADTVDGGDNDDLLFTFGGNDTLTGGNGGDTLTAGAGNDSLTGGAGDDIIRAEAGNDTITETAGADADDMSGGDDVDTLSYATSTAPLTVDPDDDGTNDDGENCQSAATCEGDNVRGDVENVTGGSGDDTITGTAANNVLLGNGGNDVLTGLAGNDTLTGAAGDDTLSGGDNDDTITGAAGNDTLTGGNGNDGLDGGANNDLLRPGLGDDTVTGGTEADTVSYDDRTGTAAADGVTVNLNTTAAQAVNGTETDTITTVESVTGSPAADTLTGLTTAISTIDGGPGDDTLRDDGQLPSDTTVFADTFIGGAGTDLVTYAARPARPTTGNAAAMAVNDLTLSDDGLPNDGYAGEGDNIGLDVESITGGMAADTITGNAGPNRLDGGPSFDTVDGGLGNDTLIGGAAEGGDTVSYASRIVPITFDLRTTTAQTVTGTEQDMVSNFENVNGGSAADTITGDDTANTIRGNGGADTLIGLGGADNLQGAAGADTISGGEGNDAITGGDDDDTINGDADNDTIGGGNGLDTIMGGAGTDTLNGDVGNDTLEGGPDADVITGGSDPDGLDVDTAVYTTRTASQPVTVNLDGAANDGTPTLDGGTATQGGDNVDTENVLGGAGNDTLTGDAKANMLVGNDGADALDGQAGNDTLCGNAGDDTLDGSTGDDTLDGGTGNDTLTGNAGAGDTVTYANRTDAVTLDLGVPLPAATVAANPVETDQVRSAENITGGSGNDVLTGSTAANVIDGGAGADTIDGNLGSDILTGNDGRDRVSYALRTAAIKVDLTDTNADQGAASENDKLLTFEDVTTGSGADTLTGNGSANDVVAGGGADTIAVSDTPPQADTVACGTEVDTVTADALDQLGADCENKTVGDPLPTLSIDDKTVTEGDSGTVTAAFTVTLSVARPYPVMVDYATQDGSATAADSDYVAKSGTLVFPANTTTLTQAIPVLVNGDGRTEPDETFTVALSNETNATVTKRNGTGTILDDDTPTVTLTGPGSLTEGSTGTKSFPFTVTLSKTSTTPTTVSFSTANGSATAGTDYVAMTNQTVTIPAGLTSTSVNVVVNGDTTVEDDETFSATIANPTNSKLGTPATATATIANDDTPTVQFSAGTASKAEGDTGTSTLPLTVTLSQPQPTKTTTVRLDTANGTATAGSDYVAITNQTVTFAPGETSKTVNVTINGDTTVEDDETLTATLTAPNAQATLGTPATLTATITNDDTPSVAFAAATATKVEGNTGTSTVTLTVLLSQAQPTKTTTVRLDTANGTATAGSDYVAITNQTVTFAPGETSKTVNVTINGDTTVEDDETLTATLSTPTNAALGTPATSTVTITNDDTPVATIANAPAVTEGNAGTVNAVFPITLDKPSNKTVTLTVASADLTATAPGDYTPLAANATVTIAAGSTAGSVSVPVVGDTRVEPDETFRVTLTGATNATVGTPAAGTATITDDDNPVISITSPAATNEGNAGTTSFDFTVRLDQAAVKTTTVTVTTADGTATAPGDYTARTQTITFSPGDQTKTFTVLVNGDTTEEPAETFTATLSGATGGATLDSTKTTATATIANDDNAPVVTIANAPAVAEGNAGTVNAVFPITLDKASTSPVTVHVATADGTATMGEDYTAVPDTTTVTILAGQTTGSATVQVKGDTKVEDDETFTLTLSQPAGATLGTAKTGTATIANDDKPVVSLADAGRVTEGDTGTTPATFLIGLDQPSTQAVTVRLSTTDGTAVAPGDYTAQSSVLVTIPAGDTSKAIAVPVVGDTAVEDDETFTATIATPANATLGTKTTGTATIANDDAPVVAIADAPKVTEGDSGTVTAAFPVTLDRVSNQDVTVAVTTADGTATAGEDYDALPADAKVTIPAGKTTGAVSVTVRGDTKVEPDETFTATLSAPVNATLGTAKGTATIANDDQAPPPPTPPTISVADATAAEGNSGTTALAFTVTLSAPAPGPVSATVATSDFTAKAGEDYTAVSGPVSFAAGETSKIVLVPVTGDTAVEPNELLALTLSNPSGATLGRAAAAGTIVNDDATAAAAQTRLSLSGKPTRDRKAPFVFTVSGKLTRTDAKPASCRGGQVALRFYRNKKTIATRSVALLSSCKYATRISFTDLRTAGGRGKLSVSAKFLGTDALQKVNAKGISIRIG